MYETEIFHHKGGYQKVGGFPVVALARVERISSTEHKTNEEVLYKGKEDEISMATIIERHKGRLVTY